ncbi:MAG TPA: hypothetical protein VF669_21675 [Tepidisphaeraceae bacterium]|jgi:uncharacterized protein YejL (UPF0352 family)
MDPQPIRAEPILDYAAPRRHSRIRLPAESTIIVERRETGKVRIIETLAGANGAVGALIFGAAIILLQLSQMWTFLHHYLKRHSPDDQLVLIVLGTTSTAMLVTMVAIILQTWRKTIFDVRDGTLTLTFKGLLSSRKFGWNAGEVSLTVVTTHTSSIGHSLGELELISHKYPLIRLLTDHKIGEVTQIHRLLQGALAGELIDAGPSEVDPATMNHLRQKRQEWSSRLK